MRVSATIAGLALVLAGVTGCGGDDEERAGSAPTPTTEAAAVEEVSEDDFCAAIDGFTDGIEATADDDEAASYAQEHVDDLAGNGLPAGAPDEVRAGLDALAALGESLPEGATADDLAAAEEAQSDADAEAQDTFEDYADDLCHPEEASSDDAEATVDPTQDAVESASPAFTGEPTVEEFCAVLSEVADNVEGLDDDALAGVMGAQLSYIATVGLPADAPLDAKLGLEVLLAAYDGLGDAPTNADLAAAYASLTPEEQSQQEALGTYTDATCPGA